MHHLDRTLRELEADAGELEGGDYEFEGDYELEGGDYELEGGDYELEGGDYELEGGDFELEGGDYELEGGDYEFDPEMDEFELLQDEEFESGYDREGDLGMELEGEGGSVFDEVEEMELAGTLLEVSDERELDYFIKGILKKAGRILGTPQGKALADVLKKVARKALPAAGAALGNLVVPGVGGLAGSQLGSAATRIFGLELEGMSPQDQEFEIARRFVRLAGAAAEEVAQSPSSGPPADAAKNAVVRVARLHAPGLVGRGGWSGRRGANYGGRRWRYDGTGSTGSGWGYGAPGSMGGSGGGWGGGRTGRWIRRGRRIILYGV